MTKIKIPQDKKKHIIAGFVISLLGFIHPILFILAPIAGIGKEIRDKVTKKGTPDINDFFYTISGAYLVIIIYVLIHVISNL